MREKVAANITIFPMCNISYEGKSSSKHYYFSDNFASRFCRAFFHVLIVEKGTLSLNPFFAFG